MITRSYALVPDAGGERLLLRRGADGWEIPRVETTDPKPWHFVEEVNRSFAELLDLELTTLRSVVNQEVDDELRLRFYELELHGSQAVPAGADWHTRSDLGRIELVEPEHREVLLRCLAERDDDGGALRIPWARPGWFGPAVTWIREQLAGLGREVTEVVQERAWSISTVLRAATSEGDFYFKAVAPVFAGEPRVTRGLAERHPGLVPELLAIDEEREWMLMRDLGGDSLSRESDPALLAEALRRYAGMQVDWVGNEAELLSLGCPDRRLEGLEAHMELLSDTDAMLAGNPERISAEALEGVPALAERLRTACARLLEYELPATLEHGDLHTDNVRERDGEFAIFDWSDACLSHPFFSVVPYFEFHDEPLPQRTREQLRDAYLEAWRDFASADQLVEAFELAQLVGPFHQAVSYYRLAAGTEPRARWEWDGGFGYFVRMLLEHDATP